MDNLQGMTYQTFEQDPVKYQKYEEVSGELIRINQSAITRRRRFTRLYLSGLHQKGCEYISTWTHQSRITSTRWSRVICVAGAGRGPLVARCLSAIARVKRNALIYAIEKNPSAYVT